MSCIVYTVQNWEECLRDGRIVLPFRGASTGGWQNPMKFNTGKCEVLPCGRNDPRHQDRLKFNFAEKDMKVLEDKKLPMSQQCALAVKKTKGSLASWAASRRVFLAGLGR